jgi:hypothetical protein
MEESKARHPTAWRPDMSRMRMRMAEVLASAGVAHPDVAASALAARGALGLDRQCFAQLLALDESMVVAVEGGAVAATAVPPSMRALTSPPPRHGGGVPE